MSSRTLFIALVLLSSCSNHTTQRLSLQGDFEIEDGDRAMLNLRLWPIGDSVIGTHIFVTQSGNRIDYCDEDSISVLLKRVTETTYEGALHDCYWDDTNRVKVIHREPKLTLIHTVSSHSLVDDTLEFTRSID